MKLRHLAEEAEDIDDAQQILDDPATLMSAATTSATQAMGLPKPKMR